MGLCFILLAWLWALPGVPASQGVLALVGRIDPSSLPCKRLCRCHVEDGWGPHKKGNAGWRSHRGTWTELSSQSLKQKG